VHRAPGSLELELSGTIPLGAPGQLLALGIEDPAEYAALALRQLLEERGIAVNGGAVARHRLPGDGPRHEGEGVVLARHVSAPLVEDLRIIDKASQNLHAEMALRAVGRARRNEGSRAAGLDELRAFLTEAGIADDLLQHRRRLGSLAPQPGDPGGGGEAAAVHVQLAPARHLDFLSPGGRQGRHAGRPLRRHARVRAAFYAKTGTMAHVNALSGYAQRRDGSWVAFSILVNNSNQSAAAVRAVMDKICILIWK
jgi:serine-type D-Ala-D-Ala carboxypeptidase/endopeptidase (penicillin-binding protein 4)